MRGRSWSGWSAWRWPWLSVASEITHRCGADVSASWFVTPTRNAALVLTFAGPAILALVRLLRWLEARHTDHIPHARVLR